jgi:hypothetical protein
MTTASFFLDTEPPFPASKVAEKERQYSHWLKVAEACKTCRQTKDTKELIRILQMELLGKRRPIIINRVYSCFAVIRSEGEYEALLERFKAYAPFNLDDDMFYETKLRSWAYANAYIQTLDVTPLTRIRHMMCYELRHENRYYMLQRMFTKYQTIRRKMEKREMFSWNPKKMSNITCANWFGD